MGGLILLRHGEPEGGAGRCYGRLDLAPGPDTPALAARLAAALPPVPRIVTSPLARARALAEALAAARGLALAADPRLAELDFGGWEGLSWEAVPRAALDAWAADLLNARPHGGETVAELARRVSAALSDVEAGGGALVVTHMGPIRAALARAGRPDPWAARLGFGDWIAL